ncbi:L-ribulose-5-phosphate 3-epimerase [Anaeropeptidivorans aminofermentans]|uniref:L-ribulose-5-phosphate 3-epimerase n=1 Tax=Anaeropeptidivorans aminofermentans TaxID=2934315 RepID=UPI0020252CC3|nr:L-ribulose-5-phosphate 3-epimerase [Anaeropeptidivorans aminofermentans]
MESYLLGLYEKSMPNSLTIREKLEAAKKAGFDYMELSIDETDEKLSRLEWKDEEIFKLLTDIYETGIPIKSICLSGHRKYPLGHLDKEIQKKSLNIMEKAIALAEKLGVRIIQIAGYDVYYTESTEETRAIFAKNLKASVKMAAKKGIILAFETMETEFINTVGKANQWVVQMDSPYLQIYPDIGNITNAAKVYGTDVLKDLRSGAGHICALHLKETVPNVFREVPYGTGHVDFPNAIATAYELGVRLFVGEFWHLGEENWPEVLKDNNLFLRDNIKKGMKIINCN